MAALAALAALAATAAPRVVAFLVCAACVACVAWLLWMQRARSGPCKPLPRDADAFQYMSARRVARVVPPGTTSLGLLAVHPELPELCPNLVRYIHELAEQFEVVLLLTDRRVSANLPPNCRVVLAPNQALDFGKWAYVLSRAHLPSLRHLGLFNDSCFLVSSLGPCFQHARRHGWGVWGMTRSTEGKPHLQSYFVVADGAGAARHLLAFFSGRDMQHTMGPCYSKVDLVWEFEFGLSVHLGRHFPLHACFSVRDKTNPSMEHWDELLDRGCPLLKKLRRRKDIDVLARLGPEYAATITGIDDRAFVTPPPP